MNCPVVISLLHLFQRRILPCIDIKIPLSKTFTAPIAMPILIGASELENLYGLMAPVIIIVLFFISLNTLAVSNIVSVP